MSDSGILLADQAYSTPAVSRCTPKSPTDRNGLPGQLERHGAQSFTLLASFRSPLETLAGGRALPWCPACAASSPSRITFFLVQFYGIWADCCSLHSWGVANTGITHWGQFWEGRSTQIRGICLFSFSSSQHVFVRVPAYLYVYLMCAGTMEAKRGRQIPCS